MLQRFLALSGLAALCAGAWTASADYIRDEVRVNMRSGPSSDHRILRVLSSGDSIGRLGEDDGWVRVRTPDGEEGWVPIAYVTQEVPPSVSLPRVQLQLRDAQAQLEQLTTQMAQQALAVQHLNELRARNQLLEDENRELARGDNWKKWLTGAAIAGVFLAMGATWPRGGAQQRTRRIKL